MFSLARVRQVVRGLLGVARPLPPGRRCSADQVIRAAVSASLHSPVGSTCLATSLVAQAMLSRHGHEARLRLGARREEDGVFRAHAWLEQAGRVVVGGSAQVATYTPFPELEHLIQ